MKSVGVCLVEAKQLKHQRIALYDRTNYSPVINLLGAGHRL